MSTIARLILLVVTTGLLQQCSYSQNNNSTTNTAKMDTTKKNNPVYSTSDTSKINMSEEEWKKILPSDVFYIARQKGTERPWTSKFEKFKEVGTYYCAACGNALFKSDSKFASGCGWPSFYDVKDTKAVKLVADNALGMERVEVTCANCGGHLGHVFNDAYDQPTGMRFCINSLSLDFSENDK